MAEALQRRVHHQHRRGEGAVGPRHGAGVRPAVCRRFCAADHDVANIIRDGRLTLNPWKPGLMTGGPDRPILLWSPDSRKIATQQQDERNVGDMYLVETRVGHPELRSWKYPLPGDSVVAMLHRVIIDVDAGRVTRLQLSPEYHRATLGDNMLAPFVNADQVGVIGYSAGGETALILSVALLLGVVPAGASEIVRSFKEQIPVGDADEIALDFPVGEVTVEAAFSVAGDTVALELTAVTTRPTVVSSSCSAFSRSYAFWERWWVPAMAHRV